MNEPLVVEVYDWDSDGDNDFIGSCTCTLHELTTQLNLGRQLMNPSMKKFVFKISQNVLLCDY